jgi:hypothetical protein
VFEQENTTMNNPQPNQQQSNQQQSNQQLRSKLDQIAQAKDNPQRIQQLVEEAKQALDQQR